MFSIRKLESEYFSFLRVHIGYHQMHSCSVGNNENEPGVVLLSLGYRREYMMPVSFGLQGLMIAAYSTRSTYKDKTRIKS